MKKTLLFLVVFFSAFSSCFLKKNEIKDEIITSQKRNVDFTMVTDERFFKMEISPDTFHTSVGLIIPRIFNHTGDTAEFGIRFSLDRYNQSTASWENVLPQNLVSTLEHRQIMPNDYYDYKLSLFNNQTPGRYRITLDLHTKLKNNLIIGEFVLKDEN